MTGLTVRDGEAGWVKKCVELAESLIRAIFILFSLSLKSGGDVTAKNIWLAESVLDILTEQR